MDMGRCSAMFSWRLKLAAAVGKQVDSFLKKDRSAVGLSDHWFPQEHVAGLGCMLGSEMTRFFRQHQDINPA